MTETELKREPKSVQREFAKAGFSLIELTMNPLFRDTLREYESGQLTFDEFMEKMEKTAILNPRLKS